MTYKFNEVVQCQGKHPFVNKNIADSTFKHKRGGEAVESYKCSFCGFWHIGHIDTTNKFRKNNVKMVNSKTINGR